YPPTGPSFEGGQEQEGPGKLAPGLAGLPALPAAKPWGVVAGLSTLQIPNAKDAQQPQGANVVPAGNPEDVDWVTAFFKIPKDDLAKSFQDAKIPDILRKTSFLQVTVTRQ